jgi:hypothetical protein
MALLKAFFDETKAYPGGEIIGIGGFVGTGNDWDQIESPWQAVLNEYRPLGVKWLHTTDALCQRDQFARVDRPGVNYILTQLAQELGRHDLTPFFSAVVQSDWGVLTDRRFLERFPTPLDLCFENLIQTLWSWGKRRVGDEAIVPMFAYSTELATRMADIDRVYGAHSWYREIIGPIAFGRPNQVIPLQAADYLAHQARWEREQGISRPFTLAGGPTKALLWMTERNKLLLGNWFDAEGLLLNERRFREAGYPTGPNNLFWSPPS